MAENPNLSICSVLTELLKELALLADGGGELPLAEAHEELDGQLAKRVRGVHVGGEGEPGGPELRQVLLEERGQRARQVNQVLEQHVRLTRRARVHLLKRNLRSGQTNQLGSKLIGLDTTVRGVKQQEDTVKQGASHSRDALCRNALCSWFARSSDTQAFTPPIRTFRCKLLEFFLKRYCTSKDL